MAFEMEGFDELKDDLVRMAFAFDQGPGVTRALEAGAAPIEQQMKSNAASDPKMISGDLHGAIHTGKVRSRGKGGKSITIGVHRKDWSHEDYYPAYVEYGHGGPGPAPSHPYIRPAFDAKADEAYAQMRQVLREELQH